MIHKNYQLMWGGGGWINDKSLFFDGVNQRLSINSATVVSNLAQFSISIWFKLSSLHATRPRSLYTEASTINSIPFLGIRILNNGKLNVFHRNNAFSSFSITSGSSYNDASWHHCLFTKRANNDWQLYADGASVGTSVANVAPPLTIDNVSFGAYDQGGGYVDWWHGNIDESYMFNSGYTITEAAELWNGGCPFDINTFSGIGDGLHGYRMGENDSNPTITDIIGSLDGTMVNMDNTNIQSVTPC